MTDADLIDALGGTSEAARLFGLGPSAVSNWKARGIPRGWRLDVFLRCKERGISVPDAWLSTTSDSNGRDAA